MLLAGFAAAIGMLVGVVATLLVVRGIFSRMDW